MHRSLIATLAAVILVNQSLLPGAALASDTAPLPPPIAAEAGDSSASPGPAPPAGSNRAFVDLTWNHEPRGKVLALFAGKDVFVSQDDLRRFNVPLDGARCTTVSGVCYIALSSLAPSITFVFTESTLALDVTTSAALLQRQDILLAGVAPEMSDHFVRGNVLNYSLNEVAGSQFAGVLDDRFGLAKDTMLEGGVGRTTDGLFQRTYTDLTIDSVADERRTIFGDSSAFGGDLGGSFLMGGVMIQREFSLDPYSINYPTPTLQTAITQPSQALIYVNGLLVKTIDLPPGYYTLSNIPVAAGISNAQVVIRNAFGQTSFDTGTYGAISLLRKGLTDYQYGVGFLRENVGLPGDSYGPAVVTAHYRLGMSDAATIGGLVQESDGLGNLGADYDAQIGAGVLHTAAGASLGSGRDGASGAIAYTATSLKSSFAIAFAMQSKNYTLVSSIAPEFQTVDTFIASFGRQITHSASINFSEQITKYLALGTVRQTIIGLSQQLGAWSASGTFSIQSAPGQPGFPGGTTRSFSLSFIRNIGSRLNTSATEAINVETGPGAASGYQITSSALTPLDSSYNAVIQTKPGGGVAIGGWANLASPYGTLQLQSSPGGSFSDLSASLNGAIVSTPRGTFFTQAVPDAYALVVSGTPGAAVYLSGQYVGKTAGNGAMVAPFLQSNFVNNISVSNQGLALTQIITGPGNANVGPGYHNGVIVQNHVEIVHALLGKVLLRSGDNDIVPMYGDAVLRFGDSTFSSPIDEDGRVYFQGVPPGTYALTITVPGKTCSVSVSIPQFPGPTYELGTIRCSI
ncbi:MAG TPA: fimbria/pilus outer membrane usher protein [Candidatus Acidoferrales bacterium]|jgi:outer membrane usher protein|nr:fimbria/pilus outer membrane usher protein [Candidatus Acidoferrales bacterium]